MAYELHKYERRVLWFGFTVTAATALRWPIALIQFVILSLTYFLVRLGACTIHAFIQGVNEGDDPRFAKRPPDPP